MFAFTSKWGDIVKHQPKLSNSAWGFMLARGPVSARGKIVGCKQPNVHEYEGRNRVIILSLFLIFFKGMLNKLQYIWMKKKGVGEIKDQEKR